MHLQAGRAAVLASTSATVAVCFFSSFLNGCSSAEIARAEKLQPSRQRVAVQRPTVVKMDRSLELSGDFRAWQQADLHSKVAGYLRQLNVDIGSRVQAGQTIAVLEAPEIAAEAAEAAAAVQRAESEELRAKAEVTRAQAQLKLATVALNRLNSVNEKEKGLIAGQEIDEAAARRSAAEADLGSVEASLQSARKAVEAAKARQKRVDAMLDYARITAPFTGVVTKRYVDPGSMVQAGTASSTQAMPVVQIATTDKLRLTIVVPESIVPDVRVGTGATIQVPALGLTFEGRIARLTDSVMSASRTMEAQIDVANTQGRISPGMIAQVRLKTTGVRDVLAIPVQAIARRGGQTFVLTVSGDGKVQEKRVESGMETASHIEVVTGLEQSENVIVGARTMIQPGDVVEVKQENTN